MNAGRNDARRGSLAGWAAAGTVAGLAFTSGLLSFAGVSDLRESVLLVALPPCLVALDLAALAWSNARLPGAAVVRKYLLQVSWLTFWLGYCAGAAAAYWIR